MAFVKSGSSHSVSLLPVAYAFSSSFDSASSVLTEHERILVGEPTKLLNLPVDGVERSGMNLDEDEARAWLRDGTSVDDPSALGRFDKMESALGGHVGEEDLKPMFSKVSFCSDF